MNKLLLNHFLRNAIFLPGIFSIFLSCEQPSIYPTTAFSHADFDPQESIMLSWNLRYQEIIIELMEGISRKDNIVLFYNENYHKKKPIVTLLKRGRVNMKNVEIVPFKLKDDNIWIRDYGPAFTQNERGDIESVSFDYPHHRYTDYKNFTPFLSSKLKINFHKSALFSVGGGREVNGKGTIILIEGFEKVINPKLSKQQIETEYQKKFHQTNFIWLKKGIPQDDFMGHGPIIEDIYGNGTNWHIDEFCRFAGPKTILLAKVDSSDIARDDFYKIIHDRLEENFQILSKATDQNGEPFNIIRVPQAPVIYANGKLDNKSIIYTPITSYLNFVLTNQYVVIPKYYENGDPNYVRNKDKEAKQIFSTVFKTRQILTVNASDINYDGGGLHCITLPKPLKKNLSIK
jgi:agmatine deiminase